MASESNELMAALRRRGRLMGDQAHVVQYERAKSPLRATDSGIFRSGWSRTPQVTAPLPNFAGPQTSSTPTLGTAACRSFSAPGTSRTKCGVEHKPPARALRAGLMSDDKDNQAKSRALPRSSSRPELRTSDREESEHKMNMIGIQPLPVSMSNPSKSGARESCASEIDVSDGEVAKTSNPPAEAEELYAGWLSKRTSGKISGRWQCRYFVLKGCVLRYHAQPSAPPKKTFDLRRCKRIAGLSGQPRIFELDFGFRTWRLRAASPEEARRWVLLLEAGRLMSGPTESFVGDDVDDLSGDESCSSSTTTADSISSSNAPSASVVQRTRSLRQTTQSEPKVLLSAAEVRTKFNMKLESLDEQFDGWFSGQNDDGIEKPTSEAVRSSLDQAMRGIWQAFCVHSDDKRVTGLVDPSLTVESALTALKGLPAEPSGLADGVEHVLVEYLSRMKQKLERWVEECDPSSVEVGDVVSWFLLECRPPLSLVQAQVAKPMDEAVDDSSGIADSIQEFLLDEWESRSCDEISGRFAVLYDLKGSHSEVRSSDARDFAASISTPRRSLDSVGVGNQAREMEVRVSEILHVLSNVVQQEVAWANNPKACNRVASVLIAALNATLRSYRTHMRRFARAAPFPDPDVVSGRGSRSRSHSAARHLRKASTRVLEFGRRAIREIPCAAEPLPTGLPCAQIVVAADEAARFATFCAEAKVSAAWCAPALSAFKAAFEGETAEHCRRVAEGHFAPMHQHTLRGVAFNQRSLQEPPAGVLEAVCLSAERYIHDTFEGCDPRCSRLACDALLQVLVQRWIRAFIRSPPRLSTCPALLASIVADQAALARLQSRWSAAEAGAVLGEVHAILSSPEGHRASQLATSLSEQRGVQLAKAVQAACR